jgi:hypothetical protein
MRAVAIPASLIAVAATVLVAGCSAGSGPARTAHAGPAGRGGHAGQVAHVAVADHGWQVVSYHGVHVTVPASWPVLDGMHTVLCGDPFPAIPTAFVGPNQNGLPNCPNRPPTGPRDGVWLQPGSPPPGAHRMRTTSGVVVAEIRLTPGSHVVLAWYHRVLIEIGIGRHPETARSVFNSIGFAPHAPDTRAAEACVRRRSPDRMPKPQRLAVRLVFTHGGITLKPPLRSQRPLVSAIGVWRAAGRPLSFERYRVLLVRYSSLTPASPNAQGQYVPDDQNVFAWVVYAEPYSSHIPGCGSWIVYAANAFTGQGLGASYWSPGP